MNDFPLGVTTVFSWSQTAVVSDTKAIRKQVPLVLRAAYSLGGIVTFGDNQLLV